MLGKKLINAGPVGSSGPTPSNYFNTVLYTGNGGTQSIGGYINRGAVFNGSSSISTNLNLDTSSAFTWSCWISISDKRSTNNISEILTTTLASSPFNGLTLGIDSPNLALLAGGSNRGTILSNPNLNQWYHIVITYNGSGTISCYVDDGTPVTISYTLAQGGTLGIGDGPVGSWLGYAGKIDQVRIFDKALSSSEVTTLYEETHASTTKSTTDIFSDNSGVALYQLDGNANDTGGVSGYIKEGAIFSGSSASTGSRISLSNNVYGSSTTVFSASLWVKCTNTAGEIPIIGNGSTVGGTTGYVVYINSGSLTLSFANGSSYDFFYGQSINDNNWHHIVITYNNGAYVLYLDNSVELNGTSSLFLNNATPTYDTFLGNRWARTQDTSNAVLNGVIDELRIYSDILTSTEVGYIYNNTTASIPTANLQAHYKLEGNARDEQQLYDGTATNVTYAYNGTASNVTYQEATNFTPDLVWVKSRTSSLSHVIHDVQNQPHLLIANGTNALITNGSNTVTFTSGGFSLEGGANNTSVNGSGDDFVAWCFNAGTDAAASNTDGSITSTVKANTDAGFSIVKWTSTSSSSDTIGHGLNSKPEVVLYKKTSSTGSWFWYTDVIDGSWDELVLNSTAAKSDFAGTYATSDTFKSVTSSSGADWISYCFHSVDGIQKVGSYTGNGGTNYIETDFEPAFIMMKPTSVADNWMIYDNKRGKDIVLFPNLSNADTTYSGRLSFASDGFVIDSNNNGWNGSGQTYIYLAIAADPDTTTPTLENSFEAVTYTGTGSTQSIDTGFKPDLVWIKNRDTTSVATIHNSINGAGYYLIPSSTTLLSTLQTDVLSSFDSNGFTVGTSSATNGNGNDLVAWCWKAGDHDDNLPQINTEGTIDSVVSVNDLAGFSIVKWTTESPVGTVGHGLSTTPELIIFKRLDTSQSWYVETDAIDGSYDYLVLNSNAAKVDGSGAWSTRADSTTITSFTGTANADYIAYCFTSITGYQKIGTYTSTYPSTTSVNVGFQPRFVMIKSYNQARNWAIHDSARGANEQLYANLANAEGNIGTDFQFTSTGFNVSGGGNDLDGGSLYSYIYLAIK